MPALAPADRCPCLSGESYGACCGKYHCALSSGTVVAPTAEALMRSRYAAFVVEDPDYLLATWHPSTRPSDMDFDPGIRWRRLDIVGVSAGGPFDQSGTVHFKAHYALMERHAKGEVHDGGGEPASSAVGKRGVQEEVSRFVRENGRWYYLDGEVS